MSLGQVSEVFFMLIMPLCFAYLGVRYMLLVGMAAWVVRYGLFAAAAPASLHALVVPASCCTASATTFSS